MDWLFVVVVLAGSDIRFERVSEAQCRALIASPVFVPGLAACMAPDGQWLPQPLQQPSPLRGFQGIFGRK